MKILLESNGIGTKKISKIKQEFWIIKPLVFDKFSVFLDLSNFVIDLSLLSRTISLLSLTTTTVEVELSNNAVIELFEHFIR